MTRGQARRWALRLTIQVFRVLAVYLIRTRRVRTREMARLDRMLHRVSVAMESLDEHSDGEAAIDNDRREQR